MKNVTFSFEERLLDKSREYARSQGKSLNELVRDLLGSTVANSKEKMDEVFELVDQLGWPSLDTIPSRDERNAR